jgi:hypothetical protein
VQRASQNVEFITFCFDTGSPASAGEASRHRIISSAWRLDVWQRLRSSIGRRIRAEEPALQAPLRLVYGPFAHSNHNTSRSWRYGTGIVFLLGRSVT